MADIEGPYVNQTAAFTPSTFAIRASESEPAVFFCRFTYHDLTHSIPDNDIYNFILYIHIISLDGHLEQVRIVLGDTDYNEEFFNITNTQIDSNNQTNASNTIIYESQVSVNSVTPILIPKCAVEYFTIPNNGFSKITCFSSSTFVIIPTLPSTATPIPLTTTQPTTPPTTTTPPISPTTVNSTTEPEIKPLVSSREFGSIVGVLCSIVVIETTLILIFIIYQFVRYKKSRWLSNDSEVVPKAHNHARDAEITSNTIIAGPGVSNNDRAMQTFNLPNSADSDSAMGTVSSISDFVGDANIAHTEGAIS